MVSGQLRECVRTHSKRRVERDMEASLGSRSDTSNTAADRLNRQATATFRVGVKQFAEILRNNFSVVHRRSFPCGWLSHLIFGETLDVKTWPSKAIFANSFT